MHKNGLSKNKHIFNNNIQCFVSNQLTYYLLFVLHLGINYLYILLLKKGCDKHPFSVLYSIIGDSVSICHQSIYSNTLLDNIHATPQHH